MLWIFILVNALLILAAVSSDNVRIGGALENTDRNAPHVIQTFYATMGLVCCLMTAAFVNSAASRDFAYNTSGIVFSKPISKLSYLMGRFWGSTLIAVLPLLGVSIGILIGKGMSGACHRRPFPGVPSRCGTVAINSESSSPQRSARQLA